MKNAASAAFFMLASNHQAHADDAVIL